MNCLLHGGTIFPRWQTRACGHGTGHSGLAEHQTAREQQLVNNRICNLRLSGGRSARHQPSKPRLLSTGSLGFGEATRKWKSQQKRASGALWSNISISYRASTGGQPASQARRNTQIAARTTQTPAHQNPSYPPGTQIPSLKLRPREAGCAIACRVVVAGLGNRSNPQSPRRLFNNPIDLLNLPSRKHRLGFERDQLLGNLAGPGGYVPMVRTMCDIPRLAGEEV